MDLESRFSELALQLSTLKEHVNNDRCLLQKALSDISSLILNHNGMIGALSNYGSSVKDALCEFEKLKDLVAVVREEFARNHHALSESVNRKQDARDKSFSEQSANLSKQMSDFETILSELALDAKNAILKADNAEMVVTLNRKKIEQACLLMQNMQLKK